MINNINMKKSLLLIILSLVCVLIFADNRIKCNQGDKSGPQGSGGIEQTDPNDRTKGDGLDIPVYQPKDPNEIIGPQGYDDSLHWVSTSAPLGYTIYFENDPEFATANAQKVEVRYTLDENADIYSFVLVDLFSLWRMLRRFIKNAWMYGIRWVFM